MAEYRGFRLHDDSILARIAIDAIDMYHRPSSTVQISSQPVHSRSGRNYSLGIATAVIASVLGYTGSGNVYSEEKAIVVEENAVAKKPLSKLEEKIEVIACKDVEDSDYELVSLIIKQATPDIKYSQKTGDLSRLNKEDRTWFGIKNVSILGYNDKDCSIQLIFRTTKDFSGDFEGLAGIVDFYNGSLAYVKPNVLTNVYFPREWYSEIKSSKGKIESARLVIPKNYQVASVKFDKRAKTKKIKAITPVIEPAPAVKKAPNLSVPSDYDWFRHPKFSDESAQTTKKAPNLSVPTETEKEVIVIEKIVTVEKIVEKEKESPAVVETDEEHCRKSRGDLQGPDPYCAARQLY